MIRKLVQAGVQTDLIDLDIAELSDGETLTLERDAEIAAVVLTGVIEAAADGTPLGTAGGRVSVFEAPGDTVYAPPGRISLAARGAARVARSPAHP